MFFRGLTGKLINLLIILIVAYLLKEFVFFFDLWKDVGEEVVVVEEVEKVEPLKPPNPEVPLPESYSQLHTFPRAAVCSDSEVCSSIGRDIMQKEGSAVDAAIATLFCNGLLAMQSMGLGGGMLMSIYLRHEERAFTVLSREVAPKSVHPDHFAMVGNLSELMESSLAIAVPTEVMGYAMAHSRYGRLPWRELVEPTIRICRKGYILSKHQADALRSNRQMLFKDRHMRRMFVNKKTGDFHRVGTKVQPPKELCETFEMLAKDGPKSFYTGVLASKLMEDLHEMKSLINEDDLLGLRVKIVESLVIPVGEFKLLLTPPPGSGHVLSLVINILRKFEEEFRAASDFGPKDIHRLVEALKFGFVKRWELDSTPEEKFLDKMISLKIAREMADRIAEDRTFNCSMHYGATEKLKAHVEHGTAHISVVSPKGDAVSVTSSINYYFGSGCTGRETGILFNNAMADFSFEGLGNYFDLPHVPITNCMFPKESPMSSMAPTIVLDHEGNVRLVVGAAGGTKIISVLVEILVRILWLKQDIKKAIDAPRFHHQMIPNVLEYEFGILQDAVTTLEGMGHRTKRYRERGSAVCGIERRNGLLFANADYRKEGGVAGF